MHEFNTECLALTFLIYHPLPIFSTLLSILPKQLPESLKFLHPYRARLQAIPGNVVQHATNTNDQFFDAWSGYVIKSCRWNYQHEPMLSYWTVRVSCAVEKQLDATKAGSVQAQREKEENVARRLTNIINKCLQFRRVPSVIIGCYIIIERLVLAANLNDNAISTFMDAIANSAVTGTHDEALVGLAMLAQRRKSVHLSPTTTKFLMKLQNIVGKIEEKSATMRVDRLATSLTMDLIQQYSLQENEVWRQALLQLMTSNLLNDRSLETALQRIIELEDEISVITSGEPRKSGDLRKLVLQLAKSSEHQRMAVMVQSMGAKLKPGRELAKAIRDAMVMPHEAEEVSAIEDNHSLDMASKSSTSWLDLMPESIQIPSSYLANGSDGYFNQMAAAFTQASKNRLTLEEFLMTRSLNKEEASTSPNFVSFFARFWCSPFPIELRIIAISCVVDALKDSSQILNTQILLPYILTALAEPVKAIRTAVASLIVQLNTNLSRIQDTVQVEWDSQQLYGSSQAVASLSLLQIQTIIRGLLLPDLEEIKMDNVALQQSIYDCLTGSGSRIKPDKLKKSSRATLLRFLADHANVTPILRTKLALLNITCTVQKAGHLSRYEAFEPLFQTWILSDEAQLQEVCSKEKMQAGAFCTAVVKIVPASSVAGNRLLQKLSSSIVSKTFMSFIVDYVRSLWLRFDSVVQSEWALLLFEHGVLHPSSHLLSEFGLDTLTSLRLSTEILEQLLGEIMSLVIERGEGMPTTKRRKLTNGTSTASLNVKGGDLKVYLAGVTASLDLIRNAGSAAKFTLLPGLFRIFEDIQQSKDTLQNDLNHVYWLLLTCLQEIVSKTDRSELSKIDHSNIRVDLVVDTLTHTADPETQYAALSLLSSLAKLEPELVVHSMMPVFTFIGSNILKQGNDRATHVVTQTIDSVIPPLVASFRRQKGSSLVGVSGLISSFVVAFEDMSADRRLDLFAALIDKLGPEDYLSILFIVLQDMYGDQEFVKDFVSGILLKHTAAVQFKVSGLV